MVRTITFSSLYAGTRTATRGRNCDVSGYLRLRKRSMKAKTPMMIRRALMSTSPTKKTHTTKCPKKANARNATESTRACQRCGEESGGMTCAVVLPMSSETGTIS